MSEAATAASEFTTAQLWRQPAFDQEHIPHLHTAQDLDEIESAAREEGFQQGHAEGFAAGLAEGRATAARLSALLNHLAQPLADLDAEVERTLVALTIEMARRLAHLEMDLDPSRVALVVRESVSALAGTPRDVRVQLHPEDLPAVRAALSADEMTQTWKLLPDPELHRGDCRVQTDGARIDARLDIRQATLARELLGDHI